MLFREIVGQQDLKRRLREEISIGKVPHAQLFLGDNGYGSLALSLAYVQYLMCENRQADDSCGECATCQKQQKMIHPDVHFIYPMVQSVSKVSEGALDLWREQVLENCYFSETNWIDKIDDKGRAAIIGTEEASNLYKKLSLTSFEGGYRVIILWKAENMNATFANKLLKSLEEPLPKTLLVLVAEDQSMMLPTILSRTQLKKVPRLAFDEVLNHLRKDKGVSLNDSESLAARMECNLGKIYEVLGENVEWKLNSELFKTMMRSCYKKNPIEMMDWAEQVGSLKKEQQKEFLNYSLYMIRQSIVRNYTGDQIFHVSEDERNFLNNFSKYITGNNLESFMTCFSESIYHLERNANAKLLFTELSFKAMRYIHHA